MTLRGLFIRTSALSHEHRAVERMRIASNQTHCNTSTKSLRSTTRKQSGKSALVQTSGCNQVQVLPAYSAAVCLGWRGQLPGLAWWSRTDLRAHLMSTVTARVGALTN